MSRIAIELSNPDLCTIYELTETLRALYGCEVDVVRMRANSLLIIRHACMSSTGGR